jgi:hypothetical protein
VTAEQGRAGGEIVLYRSGECVPALEVKLERDTVWFSQRRMAALFTDTVGLHIRNIFKEGELERAIRSMEKD